MESTISHISLVSTSSIIITLCAIFAYINYAFFKLPHSVGVMLVALFFSAVVLILAAFGIDFISQIALITNNINFSNLLLKGMLNFLLFAGALHVNIGDLAKEKILVAMLATLGVIASTTIIGFSTFYVFQIIGVNLDLVYCFIFGALISPTDPIATMAILKKAGAPVSIETQITGEALFGESLFNDGVGVVVFLGFLSVATNGHVEASHIAFLVLTEAIGGALLGFCLGYLTHHLLKSVDNCEVEVLTTLAVVMGGYEFAHLLHTSGPIAIVVAGLMIGSHDRHFGTTETTHKHLGNFWAMVDEILNSVLFLLIGLEVLTLRFEVPVLMAAAFTIPIVIGTRFLTVAIPVNVLRFKHKFSSNVIKILTWGGLRGGISVALALSLPAGEHRETIVIITYCVVIFSIIVQGLTIGKLLEKS